MSIPLAAEEVDFAGLEADDLTRIRPLSHHVETRGRPGARDL